MPGTLVCLPTFEMGKEKKDDLLGLVQWVYWKYYIYSIYNFSFNFTFLLQKNFTLLLQNKMPKEKIKASTFPHYWLVMKTQMKK